MSTKPIISTFNALGTMMVQQYERYLPTAFDEGLTLLEKVNKVIQYLNQIGQLTNDVVTQWNEVMEWIINDGITETINLKLDSMVQDGTLDTIINQNIFADLNQDIVDVGVKVDNAIVTMNNQYDSFEENVNTRFTDFESETSTTISDFETLTNTNIDNFKTQVNQTKGYKYYGTPEEFGAIGDGVADDTQAIQDCLNACKITKLDGSHKYRISSTLTIPREHSLDGNHALIFATSWITKNVGNSVPPSTMLYVQAREPYWETELDQATQFIRNLRLMGDEGRTLRGMYLGMSDKATLDQATTVNNCVSNAQFENIFMSKLYVGLTLAEVWTSTFINVSVTKIKDTACYIIGQSVNNTFMACRFDTQNEGTWALYMTSSSYGTGANARTLRSEGNIFMGGFIGQADYGVYIKTALATKFSNVIIDLCDLSAVAGETVDDVTFHQCYLYSVTQGVVVLSSLQTEDNNSYVHFSGCNFVSDVPYTGINLYANPRQTGVIVEGCMFNAKVTYSDGSSGTMISNVWNVTPSSDVYITKTGTGILRGANNTFKRDGTLVTNSGMSTI